MCIVGTIISEVGGYIVGSLVEREVNKYGENDEYISGFRWVITTFKYYWFGASTEKNFNLVDLLFLSIGKTGGKMGYGARSSYISQAQLAKL